MDVKTTFLNGDLEHIIYMDPPPGCADFGSSGIIWKLGKSLYGLKQASHVWYKKAQDEFNCLSFSWCDADYSIFVHTSQDGHFCIIALYVNDLMILSNDLPTLDHCHNPEWLMSCDLTKCIYNLVAGETSSPA